ncbi:MAG TPA: MG2 domain-containing protein, partial [Tepidisphaeraceae bacterium]|nr:MG2 domain-containing protein [Tepidisphaeraceae bacterium]
MKRQTLAGTLLVLLSLAVGIVTAGNAAPDRAKLQDTMRKGNYRDAYEGYSKLALDPATDPKAVGGDLTQAVQCLQSLGRSSETDAFREKVIAAHAKNWRLLQAAAETLINNEHYGFIVAGKFERGGHRGGGRQVNSLERDRIRSMQLMVQAMNAVTDEADKRAAATFFIRFADMVMAGVQGDQSFRLQELSDLTTLPDYEEGGYYFRGRGGFGGGRGMARGGAPVDDAGKPIFYSLPKSWDAAKNDGERWRYLLMQATEYDKARTAEARFKFASFLDQQFSPASMARYGYGTVMFGRPADDSKKNESGPYAVSTLKDNETIALLATGIKRFELPDEFNYIKLYRQIAAEHRDDANYGLNSLQQLGQEYEDRQQYPTAAPYWKDVVALLTARRDKFEPNSNPWKAANTQVVSAQNRVDQILNNWGAFEPVMTQEAGQEGVFDFRFRNGKKVAFEAFEIDYRKLLDDVKAYLKSNPPQLSWENIAIDQIGMQLVEGKKGQYLGKQVAKWDLELTPRENHFDRRITVKSPLKKAGAFFVKAKMEGGNTAHIVMWISDTVLVKKPIDGGSYYFLADATTGQPVAKATVDFFGWEQRHIKDRQYQVLTDQFAEKTDDDGQVVLKTKDANQRKQWLVTATDDTGRLATVGFSGIWQRQYLDHDHHYNQVRIFGITDRPVYRPGNTVKLKTWVAKSQYDQLGKSPFAGTSLVLQIHNPRGDKVFEKGYTLDEYGGTDGELPLPKDTTLGAYNVAAFVNGEQLGNYAFRVEEYKKPEFEVKVDAPSEPVALGETVTATITAKYYFGAPVTDAKVKYKVTRTAHHVEWFPAGRWDWMYGTGYWWFSPDYVWYPGFREWGCFRPFPIWAPRPFAQPEIVAEREVPVGPDGTIKVEIDTALAKATHGDLDHKYTLSAEVTDQSRRTIVGTGSVIAARKPFKVYAWVHRGYYRAGDVIEASFKAQTPDLKPVQGKGQLKLLKVTYDKDMKPTEQVVETWDLPTDAQGESRQQFKAIDAGQYRLSYTVTDTKNHAIEGGYLVVVRGDNFDGKNYRFNDVELVLDKKEYKDGDKISVMVNTNRENAVVALFVRPANGVYLPPKILRLKGKSAVEEIEVSKKDMPNIFVEALTIGGGNAFTETREIVVPPESRILKVDLVAKKTDYKPGEKVGFQVKLTEPNGEPFVGSTVVTVYDKSVEYISGGSNVPDIKEFFWKWR